jgi:hypothetical protein
LTLTAANSDGYNCAFNCSKSSAEKKDSLIGVDFDPEWRASLRARFQSGRKVLKEKLGFSPCKTSAWQNTMVRLLLDFLLLRNSPKW